MTRRNVLVLVRSSDLTGVHHALALAKRVPARVFLLTIEPPEGVDARGVWMDEVLRDLVASARRSRVNVSQHTSRMTADEAIRSFVREHAITLLVLPKEGSALQKTLWEPPSSAPCQIVVVQSRTQPNGSAE